MKKLSIAIIIRGLKDDNNQGNDKIHSDMTTFVEGVKAEIDRIKARSLNDKEDIVYGYILQN